MNEKQRQVQLKMKAHSLRHQVRQAEALQRDESKITKDNRQLYDKLLTGKLSEELDECTLAHGYGKVESTGEMLQNYGLTARGLDVPK